MKHEADSLRTTHYRIVVTEMRKSCDAALVELDTCDDATLRTRCRELALVSAHIAIVLGGIS